MSRAETLATAPGGAVEEELIAESRWGAIRTLYEQGRSKKAIARELDLDIKTVRKWLKQDWKAQRRPQRGRKLDDFEEFLRGRAPEVGFNAAVLLRELQAQGYDGSYPTLKRYLQPWREEHRLAQAATVRFETAPGKQAQMDWGSTLAWLATERIRVHLFVMVLGFSRRLFVKAYLHERLDALLGGHESAFRHWGGYPETILYDNPRTIVTSKDESRSHVVWNATFKDRLDFWGITPRLCRYYRAQTKGKVESGVKYVKRNALAGRRFRDLEELNAWLLEWCVTVADQRLHGTTHERPAARFHRAERAALRPWMDRTPPPRERQESRIVPRDGYVAIETNRYPVPLSWAGRRIDVQVLAEEIILYATDAEPVRHARLLDKHQVARWQGPPRSPSPGHGPPPEGPPRLDPAYLAATGTVEVRPLARYEEVAS